jgi:hypothetical protein
MIAPAGAIVAACERQGTKLSTYMLTDVQGGSEAKTTILFKYKRDKLASARAIAYFTYIDHSPGS